MHLLNERINYEVFVFTTWSTFPKLVVGSSLVCVTQDLVGLSDMLEVLFSFLLRVVNSQFAKSWHSMR